MKPPDLVVVCPSVDRIAVDGRPRDVIGGAAWITALAARVAGAAVGLLTTVPKALPRKALREGTDGWRVVELTANRGNWSRTGLIQST